MNLSSTGPPEWVPVDTDWPALVVLGIWVLVVLVVSWRSTPRH